MNFTQTERNLIISALRVAAEQYERDANMFANLGQWRLGNQFAKQAFDALKLSEKIEGRP